MRKSYTVVVSLAALFIVVTLACTKKESTGMAPGFSGEQGTGGNPNRNDPTVTGTPTNTNLATKNSSITVGGSGWSNPTCSSSNSLSVQGINGSNNVTLNFSIPPASGSATYAIGSTLSTTMCTMMVTNAPSQPTGLVWYATAGQVTVNVNASSVNAIFSNIPCMQQTFNYPVVTVSGTLSCSQ